MSALKELFRVVGAWEDNLRNASITLEDGPRGLRLFSWSPRVLVATRYSVESGVAEPGRALCSADDVRAELRWLSLGGETL